VGLWRGRAAGQPEAHKGSSYADRMGGRYALSLLCGILLLLLSACGGTIQTNMPAPAPTAIPVNGFGSAANHPHSILAFPDKVILLATHYGLFYSSDTGATWTMVAAGPNQPMEGLMTTSLTSSSLNPKRVYVLTAPAVVGAKGTLGIYTSQDQGKSWQLASSASSLTADNHIYLAQAGNDNPDEVYVYLQALGPLGLKVSMDDGQHFTTTGNLPFGNLISLLALPNAPGQLLAGDSSDGMARSTDGGLHWQKMPGVSGGIYSIISAGPNKPIYATGDSGVYASHDGGKSFQLVYSGASYTSFAVSPVQPQVLYGTTGTGVYHSSDGGHTWSLLPHIKGNLFGLAADPTDASQVYLSLSYPTELYRFSQASSGWSSLTPKS